jgi:hypothetical protein
MGYIRNAYTVLISKHPRKREEDGRIYSNVFCKK